MKLLNARDQSKMQKDKMISHQILGGDLEESKELLNLLIRECLEDTKDLKL